MAGFNTWLAREQYDCSGITAEQQHLVEQALKTYLEYTARRVKDKNVVRAFVNKAAQLILGYLCSSETPYELRLCRLWYILEPHDASVCNGGHYGAHIGEPHLSPNGAMLLDRVLARVSIDAIANFK